MFKRGFKTDCERTAAMVRRQRGLSVSAPLDPRSLAESIGVEVLSPDQLPALSQKTCETLLGIYSDEWSAVTFPSDPPLIVFNPSHSVARQNSDLMHELAHLLLKHAPTMVFIHPKTQLAIRTFDAAQEDEANWLSGSLLLPREALLLIKRSRWTDEDSCSTYGVSSAMLKYRLGISGVNVQYQRTNSLGRANNSPTS
jgi:Zn-dependent peptidase ImmA (M78 family)